MFTHFIHNYSFIQWPFDQFKVNDVDRDGYNYYYDDQAYGYNNGVQYQYPEPLPTASDIGRDVLNAIASGLEEMAYNIRSVARNDFDSRQDFNLTSSSIKAGFKKFFDSGAWILPTTFIATTLLFRDQITFVVKDINKEIKNYFDDWPIIGDIIDFFDGKIFMYKQTSE